MTRRVLAAAVLIPLVLTVVLYFPPPAFLLVTSLVLAAALIEYLRLISRQGVQLFPIIWPLALGMPWVGFYLEPLLFEAILGSLLILMAWGLMGLSDLSKGFSSVSGNVLGWFYLSMPLTLAALLKNGRETDLLLVLVVVWISDIAAWMVGRTLGHRKITPRLSPSKTLEGFAAALFAAAGASILFGGLFLAGTPVLVLAAAGVVIGFAGILGDLFESLLKRSCGVKDSSNLIPGHGGMLDRIDSLLFALPAYFLFLLLLE